MCSDSRRTMLGKMIMAVAYQCTYAWRHNQASHNYLTWIERTGEERQGEDRTTPQEILRSTPTICWSSRSDEHIRQDVAGHGVLWPIRRDNSIFDEVRLLCPSSHFGFTTPTTHAWYFVIPSPPHNSATDSDSMSTFCLLSACRADLRWGYATFSRVGQSVDLAKTVGNSRQPSEDVRVVGSMMLSWIFAVLSSWV